MRPMDSDDFLAALALLVSEPWRHFNVYTLFAQAEELGRQRRTLGVPAVSG